MTSTTGSWINELLLGRYSAADAASASDPHDYAIDGLLPSTGASIWFGPGSVGKTQLLLWMATHLAAPEGTGPDSWLGRKIRRRGHILVLSAEDLREHLLGRLAGIIHTMAATNTSIDPAAVGARIHLLPFLSLTAAAFTEAAPSLFRRRGGNSWKPSRLLKDIETTIDEWNKVHEASDQIIGVILDSAVSMTGFELTSTEATTGFLFHLNRTARRQEVFWAIIGHTPKIAKVDPSDPQANAVGRLRGSAMWSTTPRTVVEVRLGRDDELERVRAIRADATLRDVVRLNVVKANSKDADFGTRTLLRQSEGAFEDLTDHLIGDKVRTAPPRDAVITAVVDVIRTMTGGAAGSTFKRTDLASAVGQAKSIVPALASFDLEVSGAKARPGNLADILRTLAKAGLITSGRPGPCKVVDLMLEVETAA